MNRFDLSNKRALIVGADGGIGQATAAVFAELGAELVLVDRTAPQRLAVRIEKARALGCDVADDQALDRMVDEAGQVDILVYLAALCPWDEWTEPGWDDVFDQVIDVNLRAPLRLARALMPGMAMRGFGRIVLVGSVAGRMGGMIAGAHYVASKGGLHALVKWLAQRGGLAGVLVNGVAPASAQTPMIEGQPVDLAKIPLRRKADADEVAWPIAFLASEAASYVCGTVLDVNGGVYMS